MMSALTHGSAIRWASRDFDVVAVVDMLVEERCTVLHGVPTMFTAILQQLEKTGLPIDTIRTGIVGGSKVPPWLMSSLMKRLGFRDLTIAYGEFPWLTHFHHFLGSFLLFSQYLRSWT